MTGTTRPRVTAQDVRSAVAAGVAALEPATGADWFRPAGDLKWNCWFTLTHVVSDLYAYAGQVGSGVLDDYVPVDIHPDGRATPATMLGAVRAGGALLAATVEAAPPGARAFHPYGVSDPEGFAAMGIVEMVVHTHDIARTLGLEYTPDTDVCRRVVGRLFPEVADAAEPWPALLWATGRGELPGLDARGPRWRWHGAPLGEGGH